MRGKHKHDHCRYRGEIWVFSSFELHLMPFYNGYRSEHDCLGCAYASTQHVYSIVRVLDLLGVKLRGSS